MASDKRKPPRIGRRQALTLGAGVAAGAGIAATVAAPSEAEAATTAGSGPDDPKAVRFEETDHVRRYYERARY